MEQSVVTSPDFIMVLSYAYSFFVQNLQLPVLDICAINEIIPFDFPTSLTYSKSLAVASEQMRVTE